MNNKPKWDPTTGKLIDPEPTRVASPVDNPNYIPSVADRNAEMQQKLAEDAQRPSVMADREARAKQAEETAALESTQRHLDSLTTKLERTHAGKAPAIAIARRVADDYTRRVAECRTARGYLGLSALLDELDTEFSGVLAEISASRDAVIEQERKATEVAARESARLSAAGMSAIEILDWLEGNRFVLRRKGDSIQIAPIGGVNLRERVAIKMHHAGILALLKNREDWGTVDALES